ncbi:MAG: Bcr/CflA family drug resistance efflux transporter [Hyphomicrobiales bacterium]|nr:MAG: Bcr/CflA family drug resistance efflux transporter [Hyphomicrobiales bacterium]
MSIRLISKLSRPKKPLHIFEFIALFSLVTSLSAVSIDAVLPGLGEMGRTFNLANLNDTQLVISMFIFGMVFGELFFGPFSDAIGRRPTMFIGLLIFCMASLICMNAQNMEQMLIGRIIQGFGVSGAKIASRALIRDQFEGAAMARIMSFIYMVFILVPMLAPAFGQLAMALSSWRAIFFIYLFMGVIVFGWLYLRQMETLPKSKRIPLSIGPLMRNTARVLRHIRVMCCIIALGTVFGAMLLYLSIAQSIFHDIYDAGNMFAVYFAMMALGIGLASFFNSKMVVRWGMEKLSFLALLGMLGLSSVLFLISLLYAGKPPLVTFLFMCGAMFFCYAILISNLNAMAMQSLGRIAGLGASIISSLSSIIAVIISIGFGRFYDQSTVPLALAFLLGGVVGLVLLSVAKRADIAPV